MIFVSLAYYADSVATENNLSAFELIDQKSWLFRLAFACSPGCAHLYSWLCNRRSRVPSHTCIALAVQFIVCGLILCPNYAAHDARQYRHGAPYLAGMRPQSVLIILSLIFVCQHPPHLCLPSLSGVCVSRWPALGCS